MKRAARKSVCSGKPWAQHAILFAGVLGLSACGGGTQVPPTSTDGGAVAMDGGSVTADGGAPGRDGGPAADDGGIATADGGTTLPDGGSETNDGGDGANDGGVGMDDGGAATTDGGLPFDPSLAWGPDGTPLPPQAEIVSNERFLELSRTEGFELVTPSGRAAGMARTQQSFETARTLVEERLGADPRHSKWFPSPSTPLPARITRLGNGGYAWRSDSGEVLIFDGERQTIQAVAYSLQHTASRANLEKRYRSLVGTLPDDVKGDLPASDALAALSDADLSARVHDVAERVEVAVPSQTLRFEAADPGDLGCEPQVGALSFSSDNPGWQLRQYETGVRGQGNRGTCAAHAIVAAMETAVHRKHGVAIDLSEQELYADAKSIWFPTEEDYGDGLFNGSTFAEMIARNYRLDAEVRWPYNPSYSREKNDESMSYSGSCVDYFSYCSDTNHQRDQTCSWFSGLWMCAYVKPPGIDQLNVGQVRVLETVSLWNLLEPENSIASIRAHINAGHPVTIGVSTGDNFWRGVKETTGIARGFVRYTEDELQPVGHAMLVVGYIPRSLLPERFRGDPAFEGNGFLVVKNSSGNCLGDAGHVYLSYAWLVDNVQEAHALTSITTSVTAPTITLATNRSSVTTPSSARLSMSVNRAVVKVDLFDGLGSDTPRFSQTINAPADNTVVTYDRAFTGADNGMHLFIARAYDTFNNVVHSNIVGVMVTIDNVAPTITLSAAQTRVFAPGVVQLSATANDPSGIQKVQFLRGLNLVANDSSAPYSANAAVTPSHAGTQNFVALAFDNAGNQQVSNIVPVTVLAGRPVVDAFTATPQALPQGGGTVTLAWNVLGAQSVTIAGRVGSFAPVGQTTVNVASSTTFTLTATNLAGTTTATASVTVPPLEAPIISTFVATPAMVPAGGGQSQLSWTLSGGPPASLEIDHGVGSVLGTTSKAVSVTETTTFTLTASNAAGTATKQLTLVVSPDTTAPTVSLGASQTMVTAPAQVTLTATVDDDVGVVRVEFLRDDVVIDTDATPGDGFSTMVAFTSADVGTATFTARAHDAAGNSAMSAPVVVTIAPIAKPVIESFTATPATLPAAGGTTTLSWTVSGTVDSLTIDQGVGSVLGQSSKMVSVTSTTLFTLTAGNAGGNTTLEALVTVPPDTTAPSVSLASSSGSVVAPAQVTLTATASDDVAVTEVEFYQDDVLIGVDDTSANGFTQLVSLTSLDEGTVVFTAKAYDAARNVSTSSPVNVAVSLPDTNFYVSPTGTNTSNTTCALATPCLTIAYAAGLAGSGGTVVLLDGTYDTSTQGTGNVTVPSGVMIRAQNQGLAIVKNLLVYSGSGAVVGVRIDRSAPNAQTTAGIQVSSGTLLIEAVDFKGSFGTAGPGIKASGTAIVTVKPGAVTDYTAETVALGSVASAVPFLHVLNTAEVTVQGGTFGGPGLGAQATTPSNGGGAAVLLRNNARLTLQNVTFSFNTNGFAVLESSELRLEGSTVQAGAVAANGSGGAIELERNVAGETPKAFLTDTTINGDAAGTHLGACIYSFESGTLAEVTMSGSTLQGCLSGLKSNVSTTLKVVSTNSHVIQNTAEGVQCQGTCDFDFSGGSISNNSIGASAARGGVWMGSGGGAHRLKLRGVSVTGNNASASNAIDHSGIILRGNSSASFDLGTSAEPGNNVFQNNSAGNQSANMIVDVSGVVVSAVGNTWNPGEQGADGNGNLAVGTVTTGTGVNYRIVSGSLKTSD